MKNICMIVQAPYPEDSRVRRQAERLEQKGFKVDILCIRNENEKIKEKFGLVTAYRILNNYNQENLRGYILVSISFFIVSFFKLIFLFRGKKYALLQIHNMPDFLVFTGILFKFKKIPIVLDAHDLTLELFKDKWKEKKVSFFVPMIKFVEKISFKFADKIITVNDTCKNIIVKKGIPDEKISVILNTANSSMFQYSHTREFNIIKERAKILYHGTVAHRFGIHIAIKSMILVNKRIPGSVLNIYGYYDKNYKSDLSNLIKELNLEETVMLNDAVTLEEICGII